jgi:hypothetical protein
MPLDMRRDAPTVVIRRAGWERSGLTREEIDRRFNLTADEFRVEGSLVAIGPLFQDGDLESLVVLLESTGLNHFEDFFDLSGNWPEWLVLYTRGG